MIGLTLESFSRVGMFHYILKKLDTKIYDLQFKPFLKFLKEENATIIGDKIQGSFIIGKQRVLRKKSDYLETMALKEKRTSSTIPKSEWKPGYIYESACGSKVVYFGEVWIQKFNTAKDSCNLTKVTKNYFGMDLDSLAWTYTKPVNISSRKFVKLIGPLEGFTKIKNKQYKKIKDNPRTILFSETKPKNIKYNIVENKNGYLRKYKDNFIWNNIYGIYVGYNSKDIEVLMKKIDVNDLSKFDNISVKIYTNNYKPYSYMGSKKYMIKENCEI